MNVLLVRTSALGDVVNCLPVLEAVRRHRPEARIAWAIEEAMAPVLAGHPDLDLLIPVRLRAWRHNPLTRAHRREISEALSRLRGFSADIALDLMGNHKGALLARLSGARRSVGLARRYRREPSSVLWLDETLTARGPHAVERAMSLLPALGLPADEPARFTGDKLFPDARPESGEPRVVLHPGAAWRNKCYPARMWARVARELLSDPGIPTRVVWGPGEEELAREVVDASDGAARLQHAAGLAQLARELRGARLVLGGDTGPLHLARALGCRVLTVHGPTDPRLHGPWDRPHATVHRTLPCSFCHRRMAEAKACLTTLSPTLVAERARRLLC